jgi:gas vesicle protein
VKIKVAANEKLFNRWRGLGIRTVELKNLGAIIQNDVEVSEETLIAWKKLAKTVKENFDKEKEEFDREFTSLMRETLQHIQECNKETNDGKN